MSVQCTASREVVCTVIIPILEIRQLTLKVVKPPVRARRTARASNTPHGFITSGLCWGCLLCSACFCPASCLLNSCYASKPTSDAPFTINFSALLRINKEMKINFLSICYVLGVYIRSHSYLHNRMLCCSVFSISFSQMRKLKVSKSVTIHWGQKAVFTPRSLTPGLCTVHSPFSDSRWFVPSG